MERSFSTAASNASLTNHNTPTFNLPHTPFGVRYNNEEFIYEPTHTAENATTATSTPTYTATNNHQTPSSTATTTSSSSIDMDYVQNLSNELEHTKQLLRQYQHRTEQLMELVKKQTSKIADLREQLRIAQEKTS
ncbi:hypothetical protein BY458DRAFT_529072 [Sporodiniella umbellata]|nr:hypothetical protein BY458DRAFT_529072 [Sporodiniella umbellata]